MLSSSELASVSEETSALSESAEADALSVLEISAFRLAPSVLSVSYSPQAAKDNAMHTAQSAAAIRFPIVCIFKSLFLSFFILSACFDGT